jgi:hypothetical protein
MSQITLAPDAAGTAIFTVAAPNSSTNRTLTLPDATATLVGDSATQTLTNKSIDAGQLTGSIAATQMNSTGSAPIYGCRAWVNFNGLSGAVIRASGNVASVSRTSAGNYLVTFTTAMPDANYSAVANAVTSATGQMIQYQSGITDYAAGSFRIYTSANGTNTNIKQDCEIVSVAVFR